VEFEKMDNLEHYFPEDCMECGCCAYICPSKRPLVHFLKVAKAEVWNRQAQAREALAKKENNG
jgi:electron transport complex protein RnfC